MTVAGSSLDSFSTLACRNRRWAGHSLVECTVVRRPLTTMCGVLAQSSQHTHTSNANSCVDCAASELVAYITLRHTDILVVYSRQCILMTVHACDICSTNYHLYNHAFSDENRYLQYTSLALCAFTNAHVHRELPTNILIQTVCEQSTVCPELGQSQCLAKCSSTYHMCLAAQLVRPHNGKSL
jgi:hypothetical protein